MKCVQLWMVGGALCFWMVRDALYGFFLWIRLWMVFLCVCTHWLELWYHTHHTYTRWYQGPSTIALPSGVLWCSCGNIGPVHRAIPHVLETVPTYASASYGLVFILWILIHRRMKIREYCRFDFMEVGSQVHPCLIYYEFILLLPR